MDSGKAKLIHELEGIAKNVTLPLERRLIDTAVWFHQNKDRIPVDNLGAKVEFLTKSLDIALELIAMLSERLHQAEHRQVSERLYLPKGVNISGDLRKFG